ncbi:MAG: family 43 glycosylhydrolase [Myxococcales bacterium]|nr:family 43 glycosylhydrolase [Myxococcales bacterium]
MRAHRSLASVATLLLVRCGGTPALVDAVPLDAAPPIEDTSLEDAATTDATPEDAATVDAATVDAAQPPEDAPSRLDSGMADDGPASVDLGPSLDRPASADLGPSLDRPDVPAARDVEAARDVPPTPVCRTRVTYGSAWLRPAGHPNDYDDVDGQITWDGACAADGGNSVATLSNGWRPYFSGRSGCIMAFDYSAGCALANARCATRVGYGPSWLAPANHPNRYDDVAGALTWDGACTNTAESSAALSNGWVPHFRGAGACSMGFRYTQCGGLYENPVVGSDCPDPGVTRDGNTYVMVCTGGGYRIRTSQDLVHWTTRGLIFPDGQRPGWATGDFWAPEIHRVGNRWVAYFSARHRDGSLAVGAATANNALGPYTDLGRPLVQVARPGVIDAHFFQASNGARYLLWKYDGNAVGARTPIYIQRLNADGTSLTGSRVELITNDRSWEGALVEGPWMIERAGTFYLFYSANGYATSRYAVGVARASAPTGPFTKRAEPILVTGGAWAGPGHGAIVQGPSGDWVHVYHAWRAGRVGTDPGRLVLVDRIDFLDGWPRMISAPLSRSQPMP